MLPRYRQLSEETVSAERELDSIPSIQQTIVAALKAGASFGMSHKEGGTKIYWQHNLFARSDHGDYPDEQRYKSEEEFLEMLYRFFSVGCRSQFNQGSTFRT